MSRGRRTLVLVVLAALLLTTFDRIVLRRSTSGYRLTAYFKEAIALYPQSAVKVMGTNAGTVDRITVEGNRVRIDMTMHGDVPLSPDVGATINALTFIGERNVVLSPPWKSGQPKVGDGFVIPEEHTTTPIEPDDALKAFRDLAQAIDPQAVSSLVQSGASTFGGHERSFGDLLGAASSVSSHLAGQDDLILKAAADLHRLASTANDREQQLGHAIDAFSEASGLLADERQQIGSLLAGTSRFVNDGVSLLTAYEGTLPIDLANLSQLGMTLNANAGVLSDLFASFPAVGRGIINSYDAGNNTLRLSASLDPTIAGILDTTFGRLLATLGLEQLAPCIRIPSPCS